MVRGIAGERARYRPISTWLAPNSSPASIAAAFSQKFGCEQAYVADLDAIARAGDWLACSLDGFQSDAAFDRKSLEALAANGIRRWWVDCGIVSVEQIEFLRRFAADQGAEAIPIIALESLGVLDSLARLNDLAAAAPEGAFSLDLRNGVPAPSIKALKGLSAEEIAQQIAGLGWSRWIVLDVAAVGTYSGPATEPLVRRLRSRFPDVTLVSGGGIASLADVSRLLAAGCDFVLVASALHDGRISPAEAGSLRFSGRA